MKEGTGDIYDNFLFFPSFRGLRETAGFAFCFLLRKSHNALHTNKPEQF